MFKYGKAVCYSGYREGQSPGSRIYPSYEEVLEDLTIISQSFDYIRMYDVSTHAQTALRVIREHKLPLKIMLGVEPRGEISNPNCPWGGLHSPEEIEENKVRNYRQLDELARIANENKDIVLAVAIGNENTSEWHSNLMDPAVMAKHAAYLKTKTELPITFCEGAYAWKTHDEKIAEVVDFISIHSYPLWLKVPVEEAVAMNIKDYEENHAKYPDKPIIFTEFGWATQSNASMAPGQASEANQEKYLKEILAWSEANQVTMFIFEMFDEPWKGAGDPVEPEKHWGIYNVDRTPKQFFKKQPFLKK